MTHPAVSRPLQARFLDIPQTPLCYWLRERFFELLAGKTLGDVADIPEGVGTGHDARFVRWAWEAYQKPASPNARRWRPLHNAGGYGKWSGKTFWALEWENNGARIRAANLPGTRIQNVRFYDQEGWAYSYVARGSLGARRVPRDHVFSKLAPGLFFRTRCPGGIVFVNCRFSSYVIRSISAKIQLTENYVARVPFPEDIRDLFGLIETTLIDLKQRIVASELTEFTFCHSRAGRSGRRQMPQSYVDGALLASIEGLSEREAFAAYGIAGDDLQAVLDETGTPAGWFPLVSGYDRLPQLGDEFPSIPAELLAPLDVQERRTLSPGELADLNRRLRALYEAGPGATVAEDEEASNSSGDEEAETAAIGARIPIPAETFLEELSQKIELHPISVYWLLKEGIDEHCWRCLPEERRLWADRLTVLVLHLLGHRWPKQIEAREPVPQWADPDGIIPLTEGAGEATLLERVRKRIAADFSPHPNPLPEGEGADVASIEREFAEIMGKPLGQWLSMEFFKHHTRQFKKRPIAWQIQSGRFTARKSPAFACMVYYHKLDGDLLPKIRTQYVGPLRQRMETELRGIESVTADARSDRQEKRRLELEDQIDELRQFDAALEGVIREGFASKALTKLLKDEPPDRWCSPDGRRPPPATPEAFLQQESRYFPDINDGVRVNIAPLQKAGLLAADVLSKKDVDKAIADRAQWRWDERRWCRENKLPQPGWWPEREG